MFLTVFRKNAKCFWRNLRKPPPACRAVSSRENGAVRNWTVPPRGRRDVLPDTLEGKHRTPKTTSGRPMLSPIIPSHPTSVGSLPAALSLSPTGGEGWGEGAVQGGGVGQFQPVTGAGRAPSALAMLRSSFTSSPESDPRSGACADKRLAIAGIDCGPARGSHGAEFCLTVNPLPGEGIMELFGRLAVAVKELDATLLKVIAFGLIDAQPAAVEAMRRVSAHSISRSPGSKASRARTVPSPESRCSPAPALRCNASSRMDASPGRSSTTRPRGTVCWAGSVPGRVLDRVRTRRGRRSGTWRRRSSRPAFRLRM